MAKPPVFRRFNKTDLPAAPNWIEYIFNPLNVFCEQTVSLFNKNLVIGENVQGQLFSITFTTDGFQPIKLAYTGGGTPTILLIGQIKKTDGTPITTAITILDWELISNRVPIQLQINALSNLEVGKQYTMNLVAF